MDWKLFLWEKFREKKQIFWKRESKTPTYFKILWLKAFYTWEMAAKYVKE